MYLTNLLVVPPAIADVLLAVIGYVLPVLNVLPPPPPLAFNA